jgi:hypothetical protein
MSVVLPLGVYTSYCIVSFYSAFIGTALRKGISAIRSGGAITHLGSFLNIFYYKLSKDHTLIHMKK